MTANATVGLMTKVLPRYHNWTASRSSSGFGMHLLDYFLVVAGCVAYVAALNLTTRGRVTIDEFQYWLLGLSSLVLIIATIKAYRYFATTNPDSLLLSEGFFASAWLLTLLEFVALRVTLQSESYEFPLYAALRYNYLIAGIVLSALYTFFGYATALAIRQLVAPQSANIQRMITDLFVGGAISTLAFWLFVNPAPH